jgi:hypothetical protein
MDLLRTKRTYKTREAAIKALAAKTDIDRVRYLIAVAEDGRFAPVVVGVDQLHLVHAGITVVA